MYEKYERIVDTTTGEYREFKKKVENFNEKGYLFKVKDKQRRSFTNIRLSDHIGKNDDFRKVHVLAEHILNDTNAIMVRVDLKTIRIADIEDISSILEVNIKKTKEFLSRMKKVHVIAERIDLIGDVSMTRYVFNPLFFFPTKYLSTDLYFLFQETLNKHLKPWVIKKFHEIGNKRCDLT